MSPTSRPPALSPLDRRGVRDWASDRLWQSGPPSIGTVESIKNLIFWVYWAALSGSAEVAPPVKRLVALLTRPPLEGESGRKRPRSKCLRGIRKGLSPLVAVRWKFRVLTGRKFSR